MKQYHVCQNHQKVNKKKRSLKGYNTLENSETQK